MQLHWPGVHYVRQAGIKLTDILLPVSLVLGLKTCTTIPGSTLIFLYTIYYVCFKNKAFA